MVTPGKAILTNCGAIGEASIRDAISPFSPQSAKRSTVRGTQIFAEQDIQTNGICRIARIDIGEVISRLPSQNQRPAAGEISILMRHSTAGGITVGTTLAVVGFVMMASSEGVTGSNALNDVYMSFFLKWCVPIEAGKPIDTLGAVTHEHFVDSELSVTREGSIYSLHLSGYSAPSNRNYGPANRIYSHITMQSDALNNSSVLASPIAVSQHRS